MSGEGEVLRRAVVQIRAMHGTADPFYAAVADMLDAFATDWEISGSNVSPIHPVVRVARAYLGESA